ncbi:MAG: phosphatase PAP2 family protein [Deltaproteobacteria bacterium]|nr:phosphatase PAP2 family protein [Deltaproteobacteria bacterium]
MSATIAVRSTWQRLLALDESAFLRFRALERPHLTPLMRTFTKLGDPSGWLLQGLVLALVPGAASLALRLGLAAGLATAVVQVLKRSCRRPRPSRGIAGFSALAQDPDAFSFPSGHSAVAFAVAVALVMTASPLGGFELALASCVAVSRVYLGAHYPLDVTLGAALGGLCGAGVALALG